MGRASEYEVVICNNKKCVDERELLHQANKE